MSLTNYWARTVASDDQFVPQLLVVQVGNVEAVAVELSERDQLVDSIKK